MLVKYSAFILFKSKSLVKVTYKLILWTMHPGFDMKLCSQFSRFAPFRNHWYQYPLLWVKMWKNVWVWLCLLLSSKLIASRLSKLIKVLFLCLSITWEDDKYLDLKFQSHCLDSWRAVRNRNQPTGEKPVNKSKGVTLWPENKLFV